MAKNIKKLFAMTLVVCMLVSALPLQALAAEGDGTEHSTETSAEGITTNVTTTQTTTTKENGDKTITVTITKDTEGTYTDSKGNDVTLDRDQTIETEKDTDGKLINSTDSGTETKKWTEEDSGDGEQTKVEAELIPGETTKGTVETETVEGNENTTEGETTTTVIDRTLTTETTEETLIVEKVEAELEGLQPELKFDRNDAADQKEQKKEKELYTDNGHFTDPDSITVTGAPEDYPFQYVGSGDYSGHYVSKIHIIYERDEAGNAVKDENGEYVIKELRHSNGEILTFQGVPTTNLDGPFDQATGSRPSQFMLKNEDGDVVYAYCIDVETDTADSSYYQAANLEDNTYYATEDAENHIRNIVSNGYWGTAEGTGSMTKIKEDLKAALAAGTVDTEYDITFVDRELRTNYPADYELQEGEYLATNKGKTYVCKVLTQHVTLTAEMIDEFTNGEAIDATQAAIWSFANGSKLTMDGKDGMAVGDVTYSSCRMGDSLNGENDFEGAARTMAFYKYLVSLDEELESTVVINDKNNVEDMNLAIGDKVADHESNKDNDIHNDVYEAEVNFTLAFVPDPVNDDLLVHISYVQNGETSTVIKRLAGTNTEGRAYDTIYPENGVYTLTGLQLTENEDVKFDLRLEGVQCLQDAVYIYTAQGGVGKSQTMVGKAEGTSTVDVTKSVTIKFDVDENNHVVAQRKWNKEYNPKNDPDTPITPPDDPWTPPEIHRLANDGIEIPEEPVPLATPVITGDSTGVWIALFLMVAVCMIAINLFDKKRKHETF